MFSKQLGEELVLGYEEMLRQAEELVAENHGDMSDVRHTLFGAMKAVDVWNAHIIEEETRRITTNKPMLSTLNTAATVAGTQVLFSIRPFDADPEVKFDLKAPEISTVVHKAYMNMTDAMMWGVKDASQLILHKHRSLELKQLCEKAARDALEQMLPFDEIVKYLFGSDLAQYLKKAGELLQPPTAQQPVAATPTEQEDVVIKPPSDIQQPAKDEYETNNEEDGAEENDAADDDGDETRTVSVHGGGEHSEEPEPPAHDEDAEDEYDNEEEPVAKEDQSSIESSDRYSSRPASSLGSYSSSHQQQQHHVAKRQKHFM